MMQRWRAKSSWWDEMNAWMERSAGGRRIGGRVPRGLRLGMMVAGCVVVILGQFVCAVALLGVVTVALAP